MKIKLTKKRVFIGLAVIIGLLCCSAHVYFQYFFELPLFEEAPIKKVNLSGWAKLEKGMSTEQVIQLLGDSWHKSGPITITSDSGSHPPITIEERWEYNYTVGLSLFGEVHDKAYVVYFDNDGRLASWRDPINAHEEP